MIEQYYLRPRKTLSIRIGVKKNQKYYREEII